MNLVFPVCSINESALSVLRLDLLNPPLNGNKGFKLKFNLEYAVQNNLRHIITFGGAYSNHLLATSKACKFFNIELTVFVRGEKPQQLNPVLQLLTENKQSIRYLSRTDYRQKDNSVFLAQLRREFPDSLILPEGGSNTLAVKGLTEIHSHIHNEYDAIFVACGTGSTLAGLLCGHKKGNTTYYGVSVLKEGDFLEESVYRFIDEQNLLVSLHKPTWKILTDYHFGGYAKRTPEIDTFMNGFTIPLDHVYTAKAFYAAIDLMHKNYFTPGSEILVIHTLNT